MYLDHREGKWQDTARWNPKDTTWVPAKLEVRTTLKFQVKWVNKFLPLIKIFWAEWLSFETEGSEIYISAVSAIKY